MSVCKLFFHSLEGVFFLAQVYFVIALTHGKISVTHGLELIALFFSDGEEWKECLIDLVCWMKGFADVNMSDLW